MNAGTNVEEQPDTEWYDGNPLVARLGVKQPQIYLPP